MPKIQATTLEEAIREIADRGELSGISLSLNPSHTKWRASFTPCSVFGIAFAEDEDPVKALMTAISGPVLKSPRIKVDGRLKESVDTIPQEVVEVEPDPYLAGIQAKTKAKV